MSYYERLKSDEREIRGHVRRLGTRVTGASKQAITALLTGDSVAANQVILGDLDINREVRALDRRTHRFVARHLPVGAALRLVSAVLRISVSLERIGDHAVTASREVLQLTARPPEVVKRDIELIAQQAWRALEQALDAFCSDDAASAQAVAGRAARIDLTFQRVYENLLAAGNQRIRSIRDLFALLAVAVALGRVGDLARNICEETIFVVEGTAKEPGAFRVLFIDKANDYLSQMAEAFACKAYPQSGRYESAGWRPANRLDPDFLRFMDRRGLDTQDAHPKQLDPDPAELARYQVVVSLEGDARSHIPRLPYRSVLLSWDVPRGNAPEAVSLDPSASRGSVGMQHDDESEPHLDTFRRVALEVRGLMETLRGPNAD